MNTQATTVPRPVPATPATVPPVPALALDLVYGERDVEPCGTCGATMPAVETPLFELATTNDRSLCRPCARRVHPELASAVAFLTTLARALDTGRSSQTRDALTAVLNGVELYYERHGLAIPTVPQTKPRTAPTRRHGRRKR